MFTQNNISISVRWSVCPEVIVTGPHSSYFVEIYEYFRNESTPRFLEGYNIHSGEKFLYPVEYFGNFMIKVYTFEKEYGMRMVYTETFNQRGKHLLFNLFTDNDSDILEWLPIIDEYCRYWDAYGTIRTMNGLLGVYPYYDRLNYSPFGAFINHKDVGEHYNFYKKYDIGNFYQQTGNDYMLGKWNDRKKGGRIWFGNWRVSWSYKQPRNWETITTAEIAEDILGISERNGIDYYSE